MDAREERFEERLRGLGEAIDRRVGPSDPELLSRLQAMRGGDRSRRRPGPGASRRWSYWAAALIIALVAVPYLLRLANRPPQPAQRHHVTVLRQKGGGRPIVLGAIQGVDFVTAQRGYVAATTGAYGSRNALLITADGGKTWVERLLPQGYTAVALRFTGDRQGTGFVLAQQTGLGQSGAAGQAVPIAILATQDGGQTWRVAWSESGPQALQNGTATMRTGFASFGSQDYAYVGDKILSSTTGGKSWTALTLPQGLAPVHMDFLTPRQGFVAAQACPTPPQAGAAAAGCTAELIETQDGGQTWQTVFTAPDQNYWTYSAAVSFAGAQDGWFYYKDSQTWQGYLYRTADGGKTWTEQQSQLASGRDVAGPPTFITAQVGWLPTNAGAAPYTSGLLITRDGGQTWSSVGLSQNMSWSLNGVSMVSGQLGYAVGGGGAQQAGFLVKTTNGGRTWTQLLPSLAPTGAVAFSDAQHGIGIGLTSDPQAVLQTSDGGTTWREVSRAPGQVQAVSLVTPQTGYILGSQSGGQTAPLWRTTDGGRSFATAGQVTVPGTNFLATNPYLRFFNRLQGIALVENYPDVVLESTADGGKTWTTVYDQPAASGTVEQFSFSSAADGYMLTTVPGATSQQPSTVTLASTADGGHSFQTVYTWHGSGQGAAIAFLTRRQGWVAMQENPYSQNATTIVLRTADGGRTWSSSRTAMLLQNNANGLELAFPTARDGWILGLTSLYRSQDGGVTWRQMP